MFGSQAIETGIGLLFFFLIFSLMVTAVTNVIAASLRLKAKNLRRGLEALMALSKPDPKEKDSEGPQRQQPALDLNAVLIRSAQGQLLHLERQSKQPADTQAPSTPTTPSTTQDAAPPNGSGTAPDSTARKRTGQTDPSTIDSDTFVITLLDRLFRVMDQGKAGIDAIQNAVNTAQNRTSALLENADAIISALPESALKRDLDRAISNATQALNRIENAEQRALRKAQAMREALIDWYDTQTAEIGDWYRERLKVVTFALGLIGAIAINANPILVAEQLWANPEQTLALNTSLIDQLDSFDPEATPPPGQGADGQTNPAQTALIEEIENLVTETAARHEDLMRFPIGWTQEQVTLLIGCDETADWFDVLGAWLLSLTGWSIAAFASTLGAPFWFDLLKRVINLRSGVSVRNERAMRAGQEPDPQQTKS